MDFRTRSASQHELPFLFLHKAAFRLSTWIVGDRARRMPHRSTQQTQVKLGSNIADNFRSKVTKALHYQQGHRLFAAGEYTEAVAELSLAIQHGHPAKARCHNTRGASLMALESYDDAAAAFTRALEHDPSMHTAWSNRGQAHWKRGDLRAAVADLKQASLLRPSEENLQLLEDAEAELVNPDAASSFEQALQHFASAEWTEARSQFEAALQQVSPRNEQVLPCHLQYMSATSATASGLLWLLCRH